MPEGHSVHRIARQFAANFVGSRAAVSSPQGRFDVGAAELDGRTITSSAAIGKHLLVGFDGTAAAPDRVLHVHLGIYGAWDFAGAISVDPTILASVGRMGQTGMRGAAGMDGEHEDSIASIGAPRLARRPDDRAAGGVGAAAVSQSRARREIGPGSCGPAARSAP